MSTAPWFHSYANIVLLTAYLAAQGHTAKDVAYAVEKPWKYTDEFNAAAAVADHEHGNAGHRCRPADIGENEWYCDCEVADCDWSYTPEKVS